MPGEIRGIPSPLPEKLPERIGQPSEAPNPGAQPKSPEATKSDLEGLIVALATHGKLLAQECNTYKDQMNRLDLTKPDQKALYNEIEKEANRVYALVLDSHLKVKKLLETLPADQQEELKERVKNAPIETSLR